MRYLLAAHTGCSVSPLEGISVVGWFAAESVSADSRDTISR
jgi:hypothetical protein